MYQQQICDDLECDHSSHMTECKNQVQNKNARLKKKPEKKRTLRESVSVTWKWIQTIMYSFFCISTKNILGRWRFTRSLQWYSTSEYINRLVMIGDKVTAIYVNKTKYLKSGF